MNESEFDEFEDEILKLVKGPIHREFEYQNNLAFSSGWEHKNNPSVAEEILMIQEYLNKARTAWTQNQGDEQALDMLRKVASMCLRCLANHGCPERK